MQAGQQAEPYGGAEELPQLGGWNIDVTVIFSL
jgi:hypothetical protein